MRRSGSIAPGSGAGAFTGQPPRSVTRIPARIAEAYDTLSCALRFLSVGSGVVAVRTTGAVADGAVATAGDAGLRGVVSAAVSRDVARALSTAAAVCGVDAVDTGGAPLLTDSGPQPIAVATMASESTRRTKLRVVEGSMVNGGSMRAR